MSYQQDAGFNLPPPPPPPPPPPSSNIDSTQQDEYNTYGHDLGEYNQSYGLEDEIHDPQDASSSINYLTQISNQHQLQLEQAQADHSNQIPIDSSFHSTSDSIPAYTPSSHQYQYQHQSQHDPASSDWQPQLQDGTHPIEDQNFLPQLLDHNQNFIPHQQQDPIHNGHHHSQYLLQGVEFQLEDPPFPWRGNNEELNREELGLQDGEEDVSNYFTKNAIFTPEEKRMIIYHLASRGPNWENKVKGFKVCEELIAMNPRHTKFSYNNFLRRTVTDEGSLITLRKAISKAQSLLPESFQVEEVKRTNWTQADRDWVVDYLTRFPDLPWNGMEIAKQMGQENERHSAGSIQTYLRDNLYKGHNLGILANERLNLAQILEPPKENVAESSNIASESRSVSIPKSVSPPIQETSNDPVSNSDPASTSTSTSAPASTSTDQQQPQEKKRNPFTDSDVEQIINYISNLSEFIPERFQETISSELEKLNDSHTKSSYMSFLKDNTFNKGRKLEDLIAKQRSQLRRKNRKESSSKEKDYFESDEEIEKSESKLLSGLFRPTSLGIIRRRKKELIEKEKEKEKLLSETGKKEEEEEIEKAKEVEEVPRKRRKSNPRSTK